MNLPRRLPGPGLLVLALLLCGCARQADLLTDISESEANEVVSALANANLEAAKRPAKEGLVNVEIGASQVSAAIAVLQAEGLPRERHASMGEVFRKEGLISSPLEERARYLWALSQELGTTLSQMDGVLKARVHVVLPERGNGSEPPLPSSAAVFIKQQRGYNLQGSIPQIRQLVSSSIPGLQADRVAVVLVAPQRPAATPEAALRAASAPAAVAQAAQPVTSVSGIGNGSGPGRLIAAAIAGVLLLLGIGGGAWWWIRGRRAAAPASAAATATVPAAADAPAVEVIA
jgi:type III secretion protein J